MNEGKNSLKGGKLMASSNPLKSGEINKSR